jgi:hypothetical protein
MKSVRFFQKFRFSDFEWSFPQRYVFSIRNPWPIPLCSYLRTHISLLHRESCFGSLKPLVCYNHEKCNHLRPQIPRLNWSPEIILRHVHHKLI